MFLRENISVSNYIQVNVCTAGILKGVLMCVIWSSEECIGGLLAGLSNVDRWMSWWHVCSYFVSHADTIHLHTLLMVTQGTIEAPAPLSVSSKSQQSPPSLSAGSSLALLLYETLCEHRRTHAARDFSTLRTERWDPDLLIEPCEELWMCIRRWPVHMRAQHHHSELNVLAQISLQSEKSNNHNCLHTQKLTDMNT